MTTDGNDRRIRANYIKDLSEQHERLDDGTIRLLHEKYIATGDRADRDALVLHLMPMVMTLIVELQIPYQFTDDVIQAGNLSILQYITSWDASKEAALSTYLYPAIRRDMLRELAFLQAEGGLPADWESVSFDEEDEDAEFRPRSHIQPDMSYNDNNEDLDNVVLTQQLRKAIQALAEPDRSVMFLLSSDMSQQEIARTLGVSQQTISRVIERATVRLRSILK